MITRFKDNSFSITDLIGKVRDITLEHPMTIYEKEEASPGMPTWCSYLSGHSSRVGDGCMFGQILPVDFVLLDVQADITEALRDHIELPDDQLHTDELDDDGERLNSQEMDWIAEVQRRQDIGVTWRQCVREADTNYPLD